MRKQFRLAVVIVGMTTLAAVGYGQQNRARADESAFMKAGPVRDAMTRLEKRADVFEDRFAAAVSRSSYSRTHTQDTLARWTDMLEDEIDDMVEDFKENDHREFVEHFENAMIVGSAINRAMLRKDFAGDAETEWRALRQDLNHIATQLSRPVLPNVTVISLTPGTIALMSKADVKQALEQLEASTDRFEDKFRKSLQRSTVNNTERQRVWNRWADYLEDTSDDMLKEFKENDPREFQEELERTLMVAEAINRIVLRSDLFADAEIEWRTVAGQLNVVANAFGYPVISRLIAAR